MANSKRKQHSARTFYGFDKKIGFWGLKNVKDKTYFEQDPKNIIEVSHNSEGLRDDEFVPNKLGSIICCGGSHTYGGGIKQNERYSDHLKGVLPLNVINMGHCSLGLDQITIAIMEKTKKYNPKIIIVEQYTWALHRVITRAVSGYIRPNFYFDVEGNFKLNKIPFYFKHKFIRKIIGDFYNYKKEIREFYSGIDLKDNYSLKIDPVFLSWKNNSYKNMYLIVDKLLQVLNSYCKQKQIKLLFALGPLKNQLDFKSASDLVDYDLPHKKFISLLKKNNISFLDTSSEMKKIHNNNRVIFDDGHLNPLGHKHMSKLLFDKLLKLSWV